MNEVKRILDNKSTGMVVSVVSNLLGYISKYSNNYEENDFKLTRINSRTYSDKAENHSAVEEGETTEKLESLLDLENKDQETLNTYSKELYSYLENRLKVTNKKDTKSLIENLNKITW